MNKFRRLNLNVRKQSNHLNVVKTLDEDISNKKIHLKI